MKIKAAYYTSGHGLGHFTRSVEVARALVERGHDVIAISALKPDMWTSYVEGCPGVLTVRQVVLDAGAVQSGPLHVDVIKTLEEYVRVDKTVDITAEAAWLKSEGCNLVLSDATPLACTAARLAGIPSVPVVNFTWDLMYGALARIMGEAPDGPYSRAVAEVSAHYANATMCIRLPGFSPMPAFKALVEGPLVVRSPKRTRGDVRQELGLKEDDKVLLITFGGHGSYFGIHPDSLPEGWVGLCVASGDAEEAFPGRFRGIKLGAYHFPDLVNAVDCVMGKLGYGMISECLSLGVPLIYVPRSNWMEEPFFKTFVRVRNCGLMMPFDDFAAGNWSPYLNQAAAMDIKYEGSTSAADVAIILEKLLAAGGDPTAAFGASSAAGAGAAPPGADALLLDRTYWDFMFGPGSGTDFNKLEVPDWYLTQASAGPVAGLGASLSIAPPSASVSVHVSSLGSPGAAAASPKSLSVKEEFSRLGAYRIVEGSDRGLADVRTFLSELSRMASASRDPIAAARTLSREEQAAAGLFDWTREVVVARAPGRMDVIGGIADYSGSLVLQMPISEGCLVAAQVSAASRAPGSSAPGPFFRVASFGAEEAHRGQTAVTVDLSRLAGPDGTGVCSYEEARKVLASDPATRWAAYVAGCLVVLAREGVAPLPTSDVSVIVSSRVPEGKGVSSSASVEVATMLALRAALGVDRPTRPVDGLTVGIHCQMVENRVVGAPCGIMDQLSSSLGEPGSLLALQCRPADVQGQVLLPPHLAVWGLDCGVRHSVSGADYGSVRVAAFMGLKIARQLAAVAGREEGWPAHVTEIPPSEFQQRFESFLPESLSGADFSATFGDHVDPITSVDASRTYRVRQCTAHPVFEHQRVRTFRQVLGAHVETPAEQDDQLKVLGEMMVQSHASYSRCGLGCLNTDLLVALALNEGERREQRGEGRVIYGAKITGGGSGGTVCVLTAAGPRGEAAVRSVAERYRALSGADPYVFRGSSPGAAAFGTIRVAF